MQYSRLLGDRNVVLIGYRACGKTSVGARLAEILRRPFVDFDQVLVEEAGCSIAALVSQEGWEGFRQREKELVGRYAQGRGLVLAPGGGVVLDPDNVQALQEHGVVIWLTAKAGVIQARLADDQATASNRPGLTGADALSEVTEVLEARAPLYRRAAQVVVDTTGLTIEQVVEQVLAALM
jgi:shikimate kinase